MKEIEKHISPLVSSMFPAFYAEEGENFIQFVKAYYEWLEENHQLLTLHSNSNFVAGDTVTQGNTTGTVITVTGDDILVSVDGFDSFRCNRRCNDYTLLNSDSGGNTHIEYQKKMNPLYYGRRLPQIGDIDQTLDMFIVNYKEKYLRNIEFDTASNKQLLVKNSLDMYRSKGTQRSIDLFFRLVYATNADVYYPGDDLMVLSAANYSKPHYLEISKSQYSIELVGKQITGVTSGATAFVEKYIKRRVSNGFVYLFYISNVKGTFIKDELLRSDTFYDDLPKVEGSLTQLTVITGSTDFAVGDIVNIVSTTGEEGQARVASLDENTGLVDFQLITGEYGYTDSADTAYGAGELAKRTQSIISEHVLNLSNVVSSNAVHEILVTAGGTGYDNTDVITCESYFTNAIAEPTTNSTGGIQYVTVITSGSGFYDTSPNVSIANSTGGASGGSGATLAPTIQPHTRLFKYFEDVTQTFAEITYDTAVNNQLFIPGEKVYIGNSTVNNAFGTIISNANGTLANANGLLTISVANNGSFGTSNTIYAVSNTSVQANVSAVSNTTATATLMGVSSTAILTLTSINGTISVGDEIYVQNSSGAEVGNAAITNKSGSRIEVDSLKGPIAYNSTIYVRDKDANAVVTKVDLAIGIYNETGTFANTYFPQIWASNTGTTANVVSISRGTGADFKVDSLTDTETVYVNTDLLGGNNDNNEPWVDVSLSDAQYYFPKNTSANSANVMFSALSYDTLSIGTISTLSRINQGDDYNQAPFILAQQPYVSARFDYIFDLANTSGSFQKGETILQANTSEFVYTLELDDETGYEVGQQVYQGSANGIVQSINATANTITVNSVSGSFAVNATPVASFSNTSLAGVIQTISNSEVTHTAKGKVKGSNSTYMTVRRLQYDDQWVNGSIIIGQSSGTTATILAVTEDLSGRPIGLNANIVANTTSSNGAVGTLEVVNSGLGYNDNQEVSYISQDGLRAGTAVTNAQSHGTGAGFYKTTKGFLSSDSGYLHDGDYWHEYSYEILSRVPLNKYNEMFKKVMHVAGTRFFGGVVLESDVPATVEYTDSSISQS